MLNQQEYYEEKQESRVDRNERLTAIAGSVLFVLILAELVITANLDGLVKEHIFVGILLTGPLVLKMLSTGYRFIRYYTKSPEYVRKGPPNLLLRLLAPFLVIDTLLVFISGIGLVFFGHHRLFFKIHAVSVTLWVPLLAVHVYAYIRKMPGLVAKELTKKSHVQSQGRKMRLGLNIASLVVGGMAAIVLLPVYSHGNGEKHHGLLELFKFNAIPSPLSLGIIAAVIAVLVAIPLLRLTSKATR